jgi:hypothetical protein
MGFVSGFGQLKVYYAPIVRRIKVVVRTFLVLGDLLEARLDQKSGKPVAKFVPAWALISSILEE